MTLKAFLVGMPKCATTTLHKSLTESGWVSAHWLHEKRLVGRELYRGLDEQGDPMAYLPGVDAVTQADFLNDEQSLWPQMDGAFLETIRKLYPDCVFLLNHRDPKSAASSMVRWFDFQERLNRLGAPGLPRGTGTEDNIRDWISAHYGWCRGFFRGDPHFVEYDISDPGAPDIIGRALGVDLAWWGMSNVKNRPRRRAAGRPPAPG